jgi:hypothetical protein
VKTLHNSIKGSYDSIGDNVIASDALKSLASEHSPQAVQTLLEVGSHRDVADILESARFISGGSGRISKDRSPGVNLNFGALWNNARLRTDPWLRAYVRNWGGVHGAAPGATDLDRAKNDARKLAIGVDMARAIKKYQDQKAGGAKENVTK